MPSRAYAMTQLLGSSSDLDRSLMAIDGGASCERQPLSCRGVTSEPCCVLIKLPKSTV